MDGFHAGRVCSAGTSFRRALLLADARCIPFSALAEGRRNHILVTNAGAEGRADWNLEMPLPAPTRGTVGFAEAETFRHARPDFSGGLKMRRVLPNGCNRIAVFDLG